jgi:hypothetical protein
MLLLSLFAIAAFAVAGLTFWHVHALTSAAARQRRRQESYARDRAIYFQSRSNIADAAYVTAVGVQRVAAVTRFGHKAIAAIPFGILRAIPATRAGSKRVQRTHDDISSAVYDAITVASGRSGDAVTKKMTGEGRVRSTPPKLPIEPSEPETLTLDVVHDPVDDGEVFDVELLDD